MSTSLRRSGTRLGRWARPLIDPALFDFWAGHLNATWSWSQSLARIVERREEAQGFVTLVLKPNRHWRGAMPGQHMNVSANLDGRRVTRSYSLSDTTRTDGRIAITVKQVEGGKLSTHLCQTARVGDVLALGAPFGEMAWPAKPAGRWLFVAAGSGITPFLAMTRALAAQGMPVDLTLVVWARSRAECCAAEELQALARRHPRFRFHALTTREPGVSQGRIGAESLAAVLGSLDGLAGTEVRACGPGGFVATARQLLAPVAKSFVAEAFSPWIPDADDAPAPTREVQITLRRSGRTLTVNDQQALLPALEAQGLSLPSGCRMGICRTCVCTKHAGTAQALDTGDLDTENESALRLCVSRARSDLTLDL